MTIYIIRHGQTDMNRAECLQGQIDSHLNDTGIKEAEGARDRLAAAGISFERIYTSPLARARKTAEIIADGKTTPITEPLITEMHFGSYEGRPYKDIDEKMWAFIHSPETVQPPEGVESTKSLCERTGRFLSSVIKDKTDGNILIVTHGIALRSILWNLNHESERSRVWSMPIENCVIYRIKAENGKVSTFEKADELCKKSDSDTSGAF